MAVSSGVIWMFLMALFMTLLFPVLLLIVLGVKKKIYPLLKNNKLYLKFLKRL